MATRKRPGGAQSAALYAAITIGIVVMLNIVSNRYFRRFDLTEQGIYTISDTSRKLVASLPDRLTVKAFISKDLPPQLRQVATFLRDMLQEYATYSEGKMVWEALDPLVDEKSKELARRLKVPAAQVSVFQKSQASVRATYLGVAFQYSGKVESIPFVQRIDDLEYQISSTIKRLTTKRKKVAFTTGHGEPSFYQGLQYAKQALKEYEVTTVDLTEGKNAVPDDVDVLLMVGPQKTLPARAKYEVDQFLMKGKSVGIFLDGMILETPRGSFGGQTPPRIGRANQAGLDAMLAWYGASVKHGLVMDRQNARVVLPAGNQRVVVNYPGFPIVTDLNRDHPVTRDIKAITEIFASPIDIAEALAKKPAAGKKTKKDGKDEKAKVAAGGAGGAVDVKLAVLARSSKASWLHEGFFLFNPLTQPEPTKTLGPFPLAVALTGKFKSFYAGKPVPEPGAAKPGPPPSEDPPAAGAKGKTSPAGARLLVVGDSDLVKDQFLPLNQQNLLFFLNAVDFLAQDMDLIAIRSKGRTTRMLSLPDEGTIAAVKWTNIVGVPLIFVIFGLVRARFRRLRRERDAEEIRKLG